jgi:hypothetical protein
MSQLRCRCNAGTYARGTAGKGLGDVIACNGCHRDIGVRNGPDERRAFAEYETRLAEMRDTDRKDPPDGR